MATTVDYDVLGQRVRRQRRWLGLTVEALAEQVDISKGYLSRIENGKVTPALGTLANLAAALDISISDLLSEPKKLGALYRQAADAKADMVASDRGYDFLSLGAGRSNAAMQPLLFCAGKGEIRQDSPLSHAGEEFVYVLSGRLQFRVGDASYNMGAGDSLLFDSDEPHDMQALADDTRWLAVFVAPPQSPSRANPKEIS